MKPTSPSAANTDAPQFRGAEARRAARHAVDRTAKIDVISGSHASRTIEVRLLDLSVIGVGLDSPVPLAPLDEFVLHLDASPGGLLYAVVRSRAEGENRFFVGAELMCSVSADGRKINEPRSSPDIVDQIRRIIVD